MFDLDFSFFEESRISIDHLERYSLSEILKERDSKIKKEGLLFYRNFLNSLDHNFLMNRILDSCKGESVQTIMDEIAKHQNSLMELVAFYPGIHEYKAKNEILCQISGGRILPGSFYYAYRPFYHNLTTGKKYILNKTIKVESCYYDILPQNIHDFESLSWCLEHPSLCFHHEIDYYYLSQTIGEGLPIREIKSNKERQKVRRKLRSLAEK